MSSPECGDRLAARLAEAERTGDLGPLLTEDADLDALRVLAQAAPAPDEIVPFGPLLLVCWTYWSRAGAGVGHPMADRDAVLALALRNILRPLLPDPAVLPELPPEAEEVEIDDLMRLSGFACLLGVACTALAAREDSPPAAAALFDQGRAWLLDAHAVMPEEHEGFGDLSMGLVALSLERFESLAEPASLAAAAEVAARACAVVPAGHPRQGPFRPLMLDVVARAALLLGTPDLVGLEELLARCDILPLPQTVQRVEQLRALAAATDAGPGALDAMAGLLLCASTGEQPDLPALACAAERLRVAVAALAPTDHRYGLLTAALRDALTRLGRGEAELPAEPDRLETLAVEFWRLAAETGPQAGRMSVLLDQALDRAEQLAREHGLPGLPAEVRAAIAFADCLAEAKNPADRPRERLARYHRAWSALPKDHPARAAYGTVLAALAGDWSEAMAADAPYPAEELAAQVTAEAPDFEPAAWLRAGHLDAARIGALSTLAGRSWSAESEQALTRLGSGTVRALAGVVGDSAASLLEQLGGDLTGLRAGLRLSEPAPEERRSVTAVLWDLATVLDRLGGDPELREAGSALLGAALHTGDPDVLDPDTLSAATDLLRRILEHADGPTAAESSVLGELLVLQAAATGDQAMIMEAAALQEAAASAAGGPPVSAHTAFRRAVAAVQTQLLSYVHTHDPDQLERAKRAVPQLLDLADRAAAALGTSTDEFRVHAQSLADLLDIVGPGGGPDRTTSEEVLERCRRTHREAGQGPRRAFTGETLVRALLQRSMAVREAAPERAEQLVAEAEALIDALAPELDPGMVTGIRILTALQHVGPGEPIDFGRLPSLPPGADAGPGIIGRLMAGLLEVVGSEDRLSAQIAMLRSPEAPVAMRAHVGIAAAVRALDAGVAGVDLALSLGGETVGLLEKLTDRGGSQHAAEHGLLTFDGDVRGLATQVAVHLLLSRNQAVMAEATEWLRAVAEGREPVGEQPAVGVIRAISGPQVEAALALHERGRGLLLARRLESRTDLGALTHRHPRLAHSFRELTDRLESGGGAASDRERLAGWQSSAELDRVIEEIRAQPGFADFLGSLPPSRLRELAAEGPIVVLNHVRKMSTVAFVVTPEEVTALLLEDVMAEDASDAARRLAAAIDAIYARGSRRPPLAGLRAARETVEEVLSWTWHRVVQPVLDHLGHRDPVRPGADWPRLWWVPTGAFNGLPLHAAQCRGADCGQERCGSALDLVVSSFVPGFQTLAHARAGRGPDTAENRALVVSESDDVLPGSVAAARFAAGRLAVPRVLIGRRATRAAVLEALRTSQWVQFGCHAHSSPEQPAGSWIQLPDGEALSVLDICRIRPDSARLAVLTACGTARTSERLADEAVHISSAFLLAGYPEAVGTLWEIESTQLEGFLRGFYDRALAAGLPAAHALHHTVRELRDQAPDRPYVWAAYLHAGA